MRSRDESIALLKAFGDIDEKYIEEAMPRKYRQGSSGGSSAPVLSLSSLKRIWPMPLAAALAASIPVAAWGGSELFDVVREKTQEADLSNQEVSQLSNELAEQGFAAEEMEDAEPLHINESGETYGVEPLGADLIAVIDDGGNEGYVYPGDLDDGYEKPEDVPGEPAETRKINVYASDGKTVTGTFTIGR